jgi:subtilisin family serine protease
MPILADVEGPPVSVSFSAPGLADARNGTHHVLANSIRYAAGIRVNDLDGNTPIAAKRADVMNISIGNTYLYNAASNTTAPCPPELQMAINDAVTAGTTVVVAAGNASGDPSHPTDFVADHYLWGTCANVILVTAVDTTGNLAPYASTGSHVTIAAPGGAADASGNAGTGATVECAMDPNDPNPSGTGGVFSTWAISTGGLCYRYWAGTSMATPHITGTVALMKAANPSLLPGQISQILQKTAQHLSCSPSRCGAGLVNAGAAVQASPFVASAACSATPGSFTCTASITGGVAPFSYAWQGEVNATVFGATTGTSAQGGCTAGQPAWVQITVTDAIGRVSSHVTQFSCPFP